MTTIPTATKNKWDEHVKILESKYIDIIREKLGIIIHSHQVQDLGKIIHEACEKFNCTPEEYLTLLINCSAQSPILNHLVSGITVGETYFFRDKEQMGLLEHELLPSLIKTKREQQNLSIRIWSAGCASGEEIYTVAMLLFELIPDIKEWTIKLLATDINTKALQKAISGLYSEWSMRSISNHFKQRYFQKKDKYYLLSKNIMDMVTFDYLNLNDDSYPSIFNGTNSQDLILCRNVLIYFDSESAAHLMRRLNESLIISGFLMLGASDPVYIDKTDFVLNQKNALIFSRMPHKQKETLTPEIVFPKKSFAVHPQPKINKKIQITKDANIKSISEKAIELANKGKLIESLQVCEEGFKSDPTNELNYFTHALTLLELNKMDEAEASFRKSLFLDHQFVVGHFQLGLLLIRKNQHTAGLKHLQNALKIAESKKPLEIVVGSPGISYQKFSEILRNEINLYLREDNNHEG